LFIISTRIYEDYGGGAAAGAAAPRRHHRREKKLSFFLKKKLFSKIIFSLDFKNQISF
jgi:hypothetical protein